TDAEAALRLGEVAQRLLVGVVALLGQRFEEVDYFDRCVVVGGGLHDLVPGSGKLHPLEMHDGAASGIFTDASGHGGRLRIRAQASHGRGPGPSDRTPLFSVLDRVGYSPGEEAPPCANFASPSWAPCSAAAQPSRRN